MSATPTDTAPTPTAYEAPPRRPRRRLLLLAVMLAVVLGAGAAFALTTGDAVAPETAEEHPAVEEGEIVDVGTLTTNLAGEPAQYARVGVALVLSADADVAAVEADLALVKDAAIAEISRHTASDLRGEAGVKALRTGLSGAVTALFDDEKVVRVALTELLVQ